jgi:HEAT repeat protein
MAEDANSATIKNLIEVLSSLNDSTRVEARKTLVVMGSQAVPFLVEALKDSNGLRRWEATKALGEIADPKAAPALVKALEDEEFDVRWLAAKGLIEMNVKGLTPLFHALIDHGDSSFIRQGAHHVLHDLAKGELRVYLAPVLIALEGVAPASQVTMAASHALEVLSHEKVL